MRLKVPPAGQFVLTIFLCYGISKYLPELNFQFSGQRVLYLLLAGICLIVLAWALIEFQKVKTTVDPLHPDKASSLVTSGIFKFSRNPMYLGMLILLTAYVLKTGNPINLIPVMAFVWSMTEFQIKPEEEALKEIFGEDYQTYLSETRRWI